MPDRLDTLLRKLCFALVACVLLRLALAILRPNPLAHLAIPKVPTLAVAAPAVVEMSPPRALPATNTTAASNVMNKNLTNAAGTTNKAGVVTNGPTVTTNAGPIAPTATNATMMAKGNTSGPNLNAMPPGMFPGMRMNGMPGGPGKPPPPLDPLLQARIEKIIQSEILGPVQRPLPMALLGIAGADVFLRAPNGQSGLVRVGGDLGGIKLLRVGTNRVLVEEAGLKKELTIFNGSGSESLLVP